MQIKYETQMLYRPLPPSAKTQKELISGWKGSHEKPLVSVICTAFNHENYIAEAINSFLAQETNFPFEVIIHDDCSTDGTRKIIERYVEFYPLIVKPIFQKENQFSKGKHIAILASEHARGQFISLCEGDDFWLSPNKLQRQADFLLENPDCSAVTHQTIKFFEDDRIAPQHFTLIQKSYWELEDLIFERRYHTASLMTRAHVLRDNAIPEDIVSGDKAFSFLLLSLGKIKNMPEPMAVYRKNPGGISSWVTADLMRKDLKLLPWLRNIHPGFPINRYRSIIHSTIFSYPPSIRVTVALRHYFLFFFYSFSYFPKNLPAIVGLGKGLIGRALRGGYSGI